MAAPDFRQCAAVKQDGQRCRRVASQGSAFCHTHRQGRRPLTPEERLKQHCFQCDDCGRLLHPGGVVAVGDGHTLLCEPCYRLRGQIEDRVYELAIGGTYAVPAVYADLERFGVDRDLVDAAIERMIKDNRIIEVTKDIT